MDKNRDRVERLIINYMCYSSTCSVTPCKLPSLFLDIKTQAVGL